MGSESRNVQFVALIPDVGFLDRFAQDGNSEQMIYYTRFGRRFDVGSGIGVPPGTWRQSGNQLAGSRAILKRRDSRFGEGCLGSLLRLSEPLYPKGPLLSETERLKDGCRLSWRAIRGASVRLLKSSPFPHSDGGRG